MARVKFAQPRRSNSCFAGEVIWVWQDKSGWWAGLRGENVEAKSGPFNSEKQSVDAFCEWMNGIVNYCLDQE